MSQFERIRKKTRECSHMYDTKTMIKLLLLIDELNDKGFTFGYTLADDLERYGEEVVFSAEDNKQKAKEFSDLENDFDLFIIKKQREIEDMIETLSKLINTKK